MIYSQVVITQTNSYKGQLVYKHFRIKNQKSARIQGIFESLTLAYTNHRSRQ